MGVYSSAPIPGLRPSHCPFLRISNASQPTPSSIIDTTQRYTLLIYKKSNESLGYNTPTRTLRCITAVERFKVAKFENHRQVTFRKRPFPSTALTNGVLSLWIPSMFVLTRPALIVISHSCVPFGSKRVNSIGWLPTA